MAGRDPALDQLEAQLGGVDAALNKLSEDARKARGAVDGVGDAAGKAGEKAGGLGASVADAAARFNSLHAAITTTLSMVSSFADGVAALASEQAQLSANSARLGLDFDKAAASAGRFTDETEAMAAATRLSEAGLDLTQTQLEALTRVAGAFAQNTGTTVSSAIDTLTNGLITGSARGLRPFGDELARAGGGAHTASDRLAALVTQADHTTRATNDAASSMAAFRDSIDDATRTLATGFAEGIAKVVDLSSSADTASNKFEILAEDIRTAGRTMGLIVGAIGNGIALVVGGIATAIASMLSATVAGVAAAGAVIDRLRARNFTGLGAAARSAFDASYAESPITQGLARFTSDRASAGEAMFGAIGNELSGNGPAAAAPTAPRPRGRRGPAEGGGASADADLTDKFAKAVLDLATFRVRATLAAEIGVSGTGDLTTPEERQRGTVGDRFAAAQNRARQGMMDVEGHNVGTDRNENEARVDVLRERVAAMAELNRESREAVEHARAMGAPQAEINRLQQENIAISADHAQGVRDLAAAHAAQIAPMTEFKDKMIGALEGMTSAFAGAIEAWASGSKTFGDAMEEMLRSTLSSLLKMAIVEALKNTAIGIGHLATYNYPGAAQAFAAVAAWGAVAVAAGAGTAAMAKPAASAGASAPSGTGSGAARADSGAARADRSSGGTLALNITVNGALFNDGVYEGIARGIREAGARGYDLGRLGA